MAEKYTSSDVRRIRDALSAGTAAVSAVRVSLMASVVSRYHILVRRGVRAVRDSVNKCVAESVS